MMLAKLCVDIPRADCWRKFCCVVFQANIHSIMGSEDQVLELMALLDTGLQQANRIEEKLTEYERKLQVYVIP